ncbi:NAD-dependent epimerase/dehydratase family protein [Aestuariicoccus sp. MJ-SS9]|uniref:NAD-dependent epimerase/dehydratase family protein n=1 Tax=Aestuariicoccus sp. MJ-SS9 TaxID=3079855 RepID=UPI0029064244|nr:NAD-dependent epimerase/dehydratase family protein [Aestuariicoccus sp. MJ-SS9]MDU8913568.1 epimerase [Aestuariicoccus sp. MJ-SS9]
MTRTVLVLGANGRFGRHVAEAFWNAGWTVRLFDRASDRLDEAAQGVDVIANAWNPPYTDWADQLPGLTAQVIAAARASGATLLLPGNVYVYGPKAPDCLTADTPHRATNPLGRLRIEMEAAYRASGVPTILLRGGDFLDNAPSGNWFDKVIAKSMPRGVLTAPGDPDVPHAWAYLPDMARAAVALCDKRAELPRFADIPFPGHTLSLTEMAALVPAEGPVRVQRMSWTPLYLTSPFWKMARHLIEMGYLWSKPHRLDEKPLTALLPDFRPTDPREVLHQATAHLRAPATAQALRA